MGSKISDKKNLKDKLAAIDGKDYGGYQSLIGTYDFSFFKLVIQQIPKESLHENTMY